MNKITIKSKGLEVELEFEFLDNATANKIKECLPMDSTAETWGDEIYFDTGIQAPVEGATLEVSIGDIAYWPNGKCLCIFFGKTPLSTNDKPMPASEVVIIGKTSVKPELLRKVKSGSRVRVE